jgi:hypothetical protein
VSVSFNLAATTAPVGLAFLRALLETLVKQLKQSSQQPKEQNEKTPNAYVGRNHHTMKACHIPMQQGSGIETVISRKNSPANQRSVLVFGVRMEISVCLAAGIEVWENIS